MAEPHPHGPFRTSWAIDELLDSLGRWDTKFDAVQVAVLKEAADVVRAAGLPGRVVIVSGPSADPFVNVIEGVALEMDTMLESFHEVRDHVDDVLRLLRQRLKESDFASRAQEREG